MNRYIPPSIKDIGLKSYLENTRAKHLGNGYDQFIYFINPVLKLGRPAIGRLFNVQPKTIDKWMKIYKEEQKNM